MSTSVESVQREGGGGVGGSSGALAHPRFQGFSLCLLHTCVYMDARHMCIASGLTERGFLPTSAKGDVQVGFELTN